MDAVNPLDVLNAISTNTHRLIQAWSLLAMGIAAMMFGVSISAQQWRAGKRFVWPMPGGLVLGGFFLALAMLPFHMAWQRFGWVPWRIYSWQGDLVYVLIAINSVSVIVRWWRVGFSDHDGGWDGSERRSGIERRRPW